VKLTTTILVFCVAALLSLGMVMLYSSSMMQVGARYLMMQLVWCGLGLVGCTFATLFNYQHLKKLSIPLLGFSVLLLVVVLVIGGEIGREINGAKRWLILGGFRFQPSELAKIAIIIFLARYCEHYLRQMQSFKKGVLIPCLVLGPILGLIFLEPDVGTTMLIAAVSAIMLLSAGLRWRYFLPPVLIGLVAVGLFISNDPMRSKRVYSWMNLEETKLGTGLQQYQAMVALGSGGPTGLGLGNGRQKLGFVPEHHTDFIFSIIGEELGLIATMLVVLGFALVVYCGIYISTRAPDTFGVLLGTGITFMIGIQAFINLGVVTGALPNKGMPLPFISYGGSNLLVMLCSVGVLLNISRHAVERAKIPKKANPFTDMPAAQHI
jgi:cell division protein FtsW